MTNIILYNIVMLDVNSGKQTEALYKMVKIKIGKKEIKFQTTDINHALKFHKWYVASYHEGLLLEILPEKTIYDWKQKKVIKSFDE